MTSMLTSLATILAIGSAPVMLDLQTASQPGTVRTETQAAQITIIGTERAALLQAASNALAKVRTAKGNFVQIAPDGSLSNGQFALSRPGRVRFEYDAPVPIKIVSDGVTVAIEDSELETTDRIPLAATPLGLVLDDKLDFDSEARVLDVRRTGETVEINLQDKTGEMDGTLSLILNAGNYDLIGWRTIDGAGGQTLVQLENVRTGMRLNGRNFRIVDLEDEEDDDRR